MRSPAGRAAAPGSRGPAPAPATGRETSRRPPAPAAPPQLADRLRKTKRGVKKPVGPQVKDEDLRTFRGSLEEIEEVVDQAVAPTGAVSGRRRRRAESRGETIEPAGPALVARSEKGESEEGPLVISEGMTLREFADRLGVKAKDLIKALFDRGMMATINFVIEPDLGVKLATELGLEAKVMTFEEEVQHLQEGRAKSEGKASRAPVVTIMGHVDHGKTSLLDAIRKSRVTESEFGGITQHIGAYQVEVQGRKVVFLDTPGHEAFTMMRARGARATDIVVLVVAADDGIMPQTIEAISHARAAGVPLVVALNKIDRPNANPDRVLRQLTEQGLMPEDWGGQTVVVPVSALKREGIDSLLEMLILTADLLELRGDPDLP
ncbi:MAG TPA: translation initiation factor IF-2 N-terminal domain-containing protein, partial [Thermoanaerobaculia bacterium]|nr:translation initiation factor IF-2 N-terminal domain-containing protein [Thermoanaerobaculia bacterium]